MYLSNIPFSVPQMSTNVMRYIVHIDYINFAWIP